MRAFLLISTIAIFSVSAFSETEQHYKCKKLKQQIEVFNIENIYAEKSAIIEYGVHSIVASNTQRTYKEKETKQVLDTMLDNTAVKIEIALRLEQRFEKECKE